MYDHVNPHVNPQSPWDWSLFMMLHVNHPMQTIHENHPCDSSPILIAIWITILLTIIKITILLAIISYTYQCHSSWYVYIYIYIYTYIIIINHYCSLLVTTTHRQKYHDEPATSPPGCRWSTPHDPRPGNGLAPRGVKRPASKNGFHSGFRVG